MKSRASAFTESHPAAASIEAVRPASANAVGPGASGADGSGCGSSLSMRICEPRLNIGFSSSLRQQANTSRAPGAAAERTFANAASGSSKNMTPKRETTRSNGAPEVSARRSSVCASAMRTVASGTRRRAAAAMPSEMSTPTTSAPAAALFASSVPVPQPTSSNRRPATGAACSRIAAVTGANTASRIASFATHPAAPSVQFCRIVSFATATLYSNGRSRAPDLRGRRETCRGAV